MELTTFVTNNMSNMVQEITLGGSCEQGGTGTGITQGMKILVISSDDHTRVLTLARMQDQNQTSQATFSSREGWHVTLYLEVPLPFTHRSLAKLLMSTVASRLKAGYYLVGNYVYEDHVPLEMRRRKTPNSQLKGHTSVRFDSHPLNSVANSRKVLLLPSLVLPTRP